MPIYKQPHTKRFIQEHLVEPDAQFNVVADAWEHEDFFIDAAHRRGLTAAKVGPNHYFYADDQVVGGLRAMMSTLVSTVAINACAVKSHTSALFAHRGLPVPTEVVFKATQVDEGLQWFESLNAPVVVKPDGGAAGNGVTAGIRTPEQFRTAWGRAVGVIGERGSVIVQEHVAGVDIRAFVVGGRVVAAATRVPAFVTGDGASSIRALAAVKESQRNTSAYLALMPLVVDDSWLSHSGYTAESVPEAGEIVFLNGTVNLHQGGEHIDVTDSMCTDLKDLAVEACRAVPGLGAAGIDLLAPSLDSVEGAVVLEANTGANVSVHHMPAYGVSRDVAGPILDAMIAQSGVKVASGVSVMGRVRWAGRRVLGDRVTRAYRKIRARIAR